MVGSTLAEVADTGTSAKQEANREQQRARGPGRGKQGGRVPQASRTINHRNNSVDGSLLLGEAERCMPKLASPLLNRPQADSRVLATSSVAILCRNRIFSDWNEEI